MSDSNNKEVIRAFEYSLKAKTEAHEAKIEAQIAEEDLVIRLVNAGYFHCLAPRLGVIRKMVRHLQSEAVNGS